MIAVLFARKDSIYKSFHQLDVYDKQRNARNYDGQAPVIAHPPCRAWGRLRYFAKPEKGERSLAIFAIRKIRENGGVLEHPKGSQLWKKAGLPAPGKRDKYGGFTLGINQNWFGHRAEKATLLYICGLEPQELPPIPFSLEYATHVCESRKADSRPSITKAERERTPEPFAKWLVDLANTINLKKGVKSC